MLLIAVASLVTEHALCSAVVADRLTCFETCGIFPDLPRLEPKSPALQGGFLTTEPPEKSLIF